MLYNKNKKKVQKSVDCLTCEHFDKRLKKCNEIGKNCFEYDEKTHTMQTINYNANGHTIYTVNVKFTPSITDYVVEL